jgi:hypothetical protein
LRRARRYKNGKWRARFPAFAGTSLPALRLHVSPTAIKVYKG